MNDFLKNLRNSRKKESSDPKKNLDGHYYSQKDRGQVPDGRFDYSEILEPLFACLTEILPKFSENTSALIQAKIRQHDAVSDFFENLNKMFAQNLIPDEKKGLKPTAGYAYGSHYTKDEILSLIRTMRKKEATFAAIADSLKKMGIPTFSGRGEWHAQTVHRMCK